MTQPKLLPLVILAVSLARAQHDAIPAAPEVIDPEIKALREYRRVTRKGAGEKLRGKKVD